MARRGHRRTAPSWQTRAPSSKHSGGWGRNTGRAAARALRAAGVTDVPDRKPDMRPAGPKHPVVQIDGEPQHSALVWWWTIARGGECGGCSESIAKGQVIAFRAHDREVRCQVCVDREGLTPEESKRFKALRPHLPHLE